MKFRYIQRKVSWIITDKNVQMSEIDAVNRLIFATYFE